MNTPSIPPFTLCMRGQILSLETPKIMGILNITKDSFYDGGLFHELDSAFQQVEHMIGEGADIIDIGATSTRSGSPISNPDDEIKALLPIINFITKNHPQKYISIDTYHHSVAEAALESGAHLINDISGGLYDPKIFETTAQYKAPIILMHIQGTPETMQVQPNYKNLIQEVMLQLAQQTEKAIEAGIQDIIIDPGFGFGKTITHNFSLFQQLENFSIFKRPLLVGISRKSMIWKTLQTSAEQALTGTIALNMLALEKGAHILRVHDVKAAKETIAIYNALHQRPISTN
ncbi:MAG TPA: dihydropteroate synthase [Chitinophagales bacterium]|nr:dihydropteroate synthase [Chitinophagales bacterium]